MNTKELLLKLKNVFIEADEDVKLSEDTQEEIVDTTDDLKETEVEIEQEVELAEEEKEESAPAQEPVIEYATKVELQEFQKTIMDILEKMQKVSEEKKDVPEDLSSQEIELKEEVEEISHSPEVEVEKKMNFTTPKANQNTVKSRIYNKLFS